MLNLRDEILRYETETGETVEAIVVGQHDNRKWDDSPTADENVVLSREAGLAKLDEEYDNGYGGADCRPFIAWLPSRILFVSEYDGATRVSWLPRAPVDIEPRFIG